MRIGFPRFKTPNRWHSIQLRQYETHRDVWLDEDGKHMHVPAKLGRLLKIKLHRPLEGIPVTAHLVLRADGHWYALIVCETAPQDAIGEAHPSQTKSPTCEHPAIGLDVGLKVFLADSEGSVVENPRHYRRGQKRLAHAQRTVCRRTKGVSPAAELPLQDGQSVQPYLCGGLEYRRDGEEPPSRQKHSRSIHDASWSAFLDILTDKAERAGHVVVRVQARFTTQRCHRCGAYVQKSLSVRTHLYPSGGLVEDRDVNAAKNIVQAGIQAGAPPSGTGADGLPDELRSPWL